VTAHVQRVVDESARRQYGDDRVGRFVVQAVQEQVSEELLTVAFNGSLSLDELLTGP
jgi:hypothetical protein